MLKAIVNFSLNNRVLVSLLLICTCGFGIIKALELPIDAVPDITNIQVVVNTKTGALIPEQIESLVTYPVEVEMTGLPNLQEVRSLSKFGLSQVTLIFKDGTDRYFCRQQVNERLRNLSKSLPSNLSPELAPITTGLGEVFMYGVKAKKGSDLEKLVENERLMRLRTVQDRIIRPILKRVTGVADVDTNGGYNREVHINFDSKKLAQNHITLSDVMVGIQSLGESIPGGYIENQGEQIILQSGIIPKDLAEIREFPLSLNFDGRVIRVRDIADVRFDHSQRIGAATENGIESVLGTVLMMVGANSRAVARDAEEALRLVVLPEDIEVEVLYTRKYLVDQTVKTISKNLLEGALLVIVILIFFLGDLRASLIVALAIPFSMLLAVQGLAYFGISANLMSLGALDFGLIVDASVVLVENIVRKLEEVKGGSPSGKEKQALIQGAANEILSPLFFGLTIIILVYVPILGLEGIEGKMFHPMAITVILALIASLLMAILVMPVLSFYFLKPPKSHQKEPILFYLLRASYYPSLKFALNKKIILIPIVVLPLLLAGFALREMGSDFIPQLDEG